MILLDANLLLYAYDASATRHTAARRWLGEVLSASAPVRLAWVTLLAFLRIATNPRAVRAPLSIEEASSIVASWLSQPNVDVLSPTERHWEVLQPLLSDGQVHGPLVMDAHLASLAIEHGATLCTADRDFERFRGLKVQYPLDGDA